MDEETLKLFSLWVHVPLVTAWIGLVMWDVFAAAAPGLQLEQRGRLITWSRPFVIVAIIVIMVTGIYQTVRNPFGIEVASFGDLSDLRETTYGLALFWKHGFVLATFALTPVVRFWFAPRLRAASEGALRPVLWLSVLNLLACLGALIFATRMIFELH
jgi:putative copper export protein